MKKSNYNNYDLVQRKMLEGDRREVVILFADIKGFTTFSSSIDSEDVHFIIDKLMQQFSNTINHYYGYIDKYEGDQVMALFGAKKSSEEDMQNAIDSAIVMLQQLEEFNRKLQMTDGFENKQLDIRIGIDRGLVTTGKIGKKREGDFTVYGNAVNLAARLQQNAPANRIMVSEKFKESLSHIYDFQDYGTLSFKNVEEPINVFLIKQLKKIGIDNFVNTEVPFIDRKKETNRLIDDYRSLKQNLKVANSTKKCSINKPLLYGIVGDAGIGKSRFIYEFLNQISKKENILYSSQIQKKKNPYSAIISIIKQYAEIHFTDSTEQMSNKLDIKYNEIAMQIIDVEEKKNLINSLSVLRVLFGIRDKNTEKLLQGKNFYQHINTAIRTFIESIASIANRKNEPLVIFFDDIDNMDKSSFKALLFILQTLDIKRRNNKQQERFYMFICAYRPGFSFSRNIKNEIRYKEIDLKALGKGSSKIFFDYYSKGNLSDEKGTILDKSKGNPFFIKEWIKYFSDQNIDKKSSRLPSNISTLILSKIDRLAAEEKELLQKASVIGDEFEFVIINDLIDEMTPLKNNLYGFIRSLEKKGFIHKKIDSNNSVYEFSNKLIREVAYENLLKANRRILHNLIGDIIEKKFKNNLDEYLYALVEHYEKGENLEKQKRYILMSAKYAKNIYDNENAILFYSKLIEISSGQSKVILEALLDLAEVYRLVGKWDKSEEVILRCLNLVKNVNEKRRLAKVYTKYLSQLIIKGNLKKADYYADKAIDICKKQLNVANEKRNLYGIDSTKEINELRGIYSEALLSKGKLLIFKGAYQDGRNYFTRALNESQTIGDDITSAKAYLNIGMIYESQTQLKKSLSLYSKAMTIFQEVDFFYGIGQASLKLGYLFEKMGESEKAMNYYNKSLNLSREIGDKENEGNTILAIGSILDNKAEYSEALKYYKKALNIFTEMNYKIGIAHAVESIGTVYKKQRNVKKANQYFNKLNVIETISRGSGIALTYERLGDIYIKKDNYSRAAKYYRKSLNLLSDIEKQYEFASSLIDYNHNIDNIIDYYNRSQADINQIEDEMVFAKEIRKIGITYLMNRKYVRAKKHLNNALKAFMEVNDKEEIVFTLGKIALAEYYSGEINKSIEIINRVKKIAQRYEFSTKYYECLKTEMDIRLDENNFEKAKTIVEEILALAIDISDKMTIASLLLQKSTILFNLKLINQAKATCESAVRIAEEENFHEVSLEAQIILLLIEAESTDRSILTEKWNMIESSYHQESFGISLYYWVLLFLREIRIFDQTFYKTIFNKKISEKNLLISPQRKENYLRFLSE